MRLFVGTFLGKQHVEKIPFGEIEESLKGDLKTIKKENIHMTWIFIGDIEGEVCKPHLQEMIEKQINLFKDLVFESHGLELWPPRRLPRLIVLNGELRDQKSRDKVTLSLQKLINNLKSICNPDIKEDFIPHITIARFKKDKAIRTDFKPASTLPNMENFRWEIKEVSLIQSILSSEGPKYEKVKNWKLV